MIGSQDLRDDLSALDRGGGGKTTGTVNPGLVWAGETIQIGIEGVFPINDRTRGSMAGCVGAFEST